MTHHDEFLTDFSVPAFQTAFRACFGELGCRVNNWEGLFAGMSEVGRDYTWPRRDADGRVTGYVQFMPMHMSSWFFSARCSFIREFWIAPELRRQGHGGELLKKAEEWLRGQGCMCAILTTDSAPEFYRRHGYSLHRGIAARNNDDVYAKVLIGQEVDV